MDELKSMHCVQVNKQSRTLDASEIETYLVQLPEWEVITSGGMNQLKREYKFSDFLKALEFTNQVGEMAEQEDHHPAILTEWGKVTLTWWTHVVNGLHLNDFICAAKSDQIYSA
jgi:4a-hydroxytetrahydrobiopterin dehydratase